MSYPITVFTRGGEPLSTSRTLDLSRGGALLALPVEAIKKLGSFVNVTISLPEESYHANEALAFTCQARIVRRHDLTDGSQEAVALEFARPVQLAN